MAVRRPAKDILADWRYIKARRLAGDSLASIARDYGCSVRLIETMLDSQPMRDACGFESEGLRPYELTPALRCRTAAAISIFLSNFDHFLTSDTPKNTQNFRVATEELLRAAARVRLALEFRRKQ